MELNKLRELLILLREAGVAKYADDKIQLELVYEDVVEEVEEPKVPQLPQEPAVDPEVKRFLGTLPPDYAKAFDIKVRDK